MGQRGRPPGDPPSGTPMRDALVVGVTDAVAFVAGALGGWALGRWLGFDAVGSPDFDARAMVGLVFILLGCGAGKLAVQRLRAPR